MADTISTKFVLAILPIGKMAPEPPVVSLGEEYVHFGERGLGADWPSATGFAINIERYYFFLEFIKFDFGNVPVFWIPAANGCFWYDGPAVVFCFDRLSHNTFCALKNRVI